MTYTVLLSRSVLGRQCVIIYNENTDTTHDTVRWSVPTDYRTCLNFETPNVDFIHPNDAAALYPNKRPTDRTI